MELGWKLHPYLLIEKRKAFFLYRWPLRPLPQHGSPPLQAPPAKQIIRGGRRAGGGVARAAEVKERNAPAGARGQPCGEVLGRRRRLRTHRWHAKRFSMERRWGFVLLIGAKGRLESEDGDLSNSQTRFDEGKCSSLRCQLWIWIHPAALNEGLDALRISCEKQTQESGDMVNCCSLEGKMARLEVMGCKAMQFLKSILRPVSNPSMFTRVVSTSNLTTSTNPHLDSSTGSHLLKASVIDHADILQTGAILSMMVRDPRDISVQGTVSSSETDSLNQDNQPMEEDQVPNADEAPSKEEAILSSI
ncbi:hypothetical protein ABZP36_008511 [Zizania latifolia]